MSSRGFSELEIDAIGEILNISLGASATAVSTMLSARVDITTPVVKVVSRDEFEFTNLEPAVGVEITYVSGLEGDNIMLLKRQDVKVIVEMLMGMDIPDDEFVLDEMNISAICEVMNQMMGASATALSEFLNKSVNISTPISFEITDEGEFKNKYFPEDKEEMVVVGFSLKIADKLQSEFINVMPTELAKGMVAGFLPDGDDGELQVTPDPPKEPTGDKMLSQEEIAAMIAASNNETPAAPAPAEPSGDKMMSQEEIAAMIAASSGEATPTPTPPVAPI
ncbi:MAG: chemotaxis protein CheC, partial [Lachnospiraceae bacterium]